MTPAPLLSPLHRARVGMPPAAAPALVPARLTLAADSIGGRVPQAGFDGVVRAASARSALLWAGGMLVTLVAAGLGRGPACVRLAPMTGLRLDHWYTPGERCRASDGRLTTKRATIELGAAPIWASPPAPLRVGGEALRARLVSLRRAVQPLARSAPASDLPRHCANFDLDAAIVAARDLVGLGCGSTPAGDDFLVGLLAGLDALAGADPLRRRFVACFGAAIARIASSRTTALSAQYLRLAANGEFDEPLARLRAAILAGEDERLIGPAVAAALAVGSSSGAAGVAGLIAGLEVSIERGADR